MNQEHTPLFIQFMKKWDEFRDSDHSNMSSHDVIKKVNELINTYKPFYEHVITVEGPHQSKRLATVYDNDPYYIAKFARDYSGNPYLDSTLKLLQQLDMTGANHVFEEITERYRRARWERSELGLSPKPAGRSFTPQKNYRY